MMKKSDFKVGQTAFLKTRSYGMCWEKEKIEEATVKTIGRKYITVAVSPCREYQFDIEGDFCEKTDCSPTYELYLSKQDIYDYWQREYLFWKIWRKLVAYRDTVDLYALKGMAQILHIRLMDFGGRDDEEE